MNLYSSLKKTTIIFIIKIIGFILSYVNILIITKSISVTEYGIFSVISTVSSILAMFVGFGFTNSLIKIYYDKNGDKEENLNSMLLYTYFHVLLVSFLIFVLLIVLDIKNLNNYNFEIFLYVLLLAIQSINNGIYRSNKQIYIFILFIDFFYPLLKLLLFYIFYNFLCVKNILFVQIGTLFFINCVLGYKMVVKEKIRYKNLLYFKTKNHIKYLSEFLKLSFFFLLYHAGGVLNQYVDILSIEYLKGEYYVGLYTIALKIGRISRFLILATNVWLMPLVSEYINKNEVRKLKYLIKKINLILVLLNIIYIVVLLILGKYILSKFGEEYVKSYPVLIIIAFAELPNVFSNVYGIVNIMNEKLKVDNVLNFVSIALNLILNLILIRFFSFYGAAIATLLSMIFLTFGRYLVFKRK